MNGAQDATVRLSIGAPEVVGVPSNTHELFRNWRNFKLMLTHPAEYFKSKYWCITVVNAPREAQRKVYKLMGH